MTKQLMKISCFRGTGFQFKALKESDDLKWDELYGYNASDWLGAGVRYSIDILDQ